MRYRWDELVWYDLMQVEVGGLVHVQVLLRGRHSKCHPPLNPTGEIGSGYPTNIYDDNRLSLPILREKMVQSNVLYCGKRRRQL